MKTDWIDDQSLDLVLLLLLPTNRLVCQTSLATGLRIGDVLRLRTGELKQRMTIREQKTGKSRRVYFPAALYEQLRDQAGAVWVFEGRDPARPRTRQAVWVDLKRAAVAMRMDANVAPHTMRKVYAVREFDRNGGKVEAVQRALNHDREATTLLYALADELTRRRLSAGSRPGRPRSGRRKKKRT